MFHESVTTGLPISCGYFYLGRLGGVAASASLIFMVHCFFVITLSVLTWCEINIIINNELCLHLKSLHKQNIMQRLFFRSFSGPYTFYNRTSHISLGTSIPTGRKGNITAPWFVFLWIPQSKPFTSFHVRYESFLLFCLQMSWTGCWNLQWHQ